MNTMLAFSLGPMELFVLLLAVLILFGPKRLPELGAAFGKGIKSFKKATTDEEGEEKEKTGNPRLD